MKNLLKFLLLTLILCYALIQTHGADKQKFDWNKVEKIEVKKNVFHCAKGKTITDKEQIALLLEARDAKTMDLRHCGCIPTAWLTFFDSDKNQTQAIIMASVLVIDSDYEHGRVLTDEQEAVVKCKP